MTPMDVCSRTWPGEAEAASTFAKSLPRKLEAPRIAFALLSFWVLFLLVCKG
jgi:hypothetical protein